jgi:flavorubredoxin
MMMEPQSVARDTYLLPSYLPVPTAGVLPVNAFVIQGTEPVLVDTGLAALKGDFLAGLRSVMAPEALRWIWLTHIDADHVGNLAEVLEAAPRARVVTSFIGLAKLGLLGYQIEQLHLLNPGQSLDIGDRQLLAVTPATYDAPETTGFFDPATRTLFSADSFGAMMSAPAETAAAIPPDALREGMLTWASIDAPWLRIVEPAAFRAILDRIGTLGAETVLSSHLPPASEMTGTLLGHLANAPGTEPFVGMDQAAFEAMMAGVAGE